MAFGVEPCGQCGGDPGACGCPSGPSPASYKGLVYGPGEDDEPNCPVCLARLRYCPGHDHETKSLRAGPAEALIVRMAPNPLGASVPGSYGYFSGDPVAVWSPDGSRMILVEEFAYTDRAAKRWVAPKGTILDGASIPRAFWSLVGSPYRGKYRYASIVHDYHCNARVEAWMDVHEMFYSACLAGGTTHAHARILYYAVWHFGPRWRLRHESTSLPRGRIADIAIPQVAAIERWIVATEPDLASLRATSPGDLGIPDVYPSRR